MPRQPRFYYPGSVLHIVRRGNNRARVFASAQDHRFYLDCLRDAACAHDVAIHGYVLMTNHVHLLPRPDTPKALARMMQTLGRRYVGRFNFLHQRTGTLWEGRYKATLVETEAYFFACLRYIELNPVRAGIVATPGEYRWSSHRGNAFADDDPVLTPHSSFLALARNPAERCDVYRDSFGESLGTDVVEAIRDATQFEWALGSTSFREHVEARTGRRAARLPMGRPRTQREPKSRL